MLLYGRVERSKNMDLMDRIMELTEQGYCCAQILAILLLDTIGEEDPGYVRAMDGLLYGVGYSYGCCGCMTGGAAVLSYLTGRPYGEEGREYDRETWFRQEPYFRYFRKFKKTSPVMMQVESFLLKGRPFPDGRYNNAVAFLTELKTRCRRV